MQPPLSLRGILLYSAASLGAGAFYAFNNAVLPLFLASHTTSHLLIGLLSSTRSIEGTVVQPVVGAISDRIWTPVGRRKPFFLLMVPPAALFLVLTAHASALPLIVASIVLFSLAFNAAIDPYTALLADLTPPSQRGVVNSAAALAGLLGQVGLLLLASQQGGGGVPPLVFYAVALVLLLTFAITFLGIHERRQAVTVIPRHRLREYLAALLAHRQAFAYLVVLFAYNVGLNAILPFLTLFAVRELGIPEGQSLFLFMGLIAITAVMVVPWGWLGDRRGKKPVLSLGLLILAVGAGSGLVIRDFNGILAAMLIAGAGNAAVTALNWPLLTELIPPDEVGVFAGLKTAAESIAIPLSVVVAGAAIDRFGYRSIFILLAASILLAVLLLQRVQVPSAAALPAEAAPAG